MGTTVVGRQQLKTSSNIVSGRKISCNRYSLLLDWKANRVQHFGIDCTYQTDQIIMNDMPLSVPGGSTASRETIELDVKGSISKSIDQK